MRRRIVVIGLGLVAIAAVVLGAIAILRSGGSSPVTAQRPSVTAPPTPSTQTTTVTAGPPERPPPTGVMLGVNVNRLFNDGTYSLAQIDAQLSAVQATGATVARSDAFWESAEPAPPVNGVHHYNWHFDDSVASLLALHGLRWFPILDYSALWAESVNGQDHSPPSSPADYAAYAAAFASRYGVGGSFWRAHPDFSPQPVQTYEIWNEPDNGQFWAPGPDPGQYAELYQQARDAILGVDPSARVLVGGLTSATTFLPAMLAARPDLRGHIDGVALHPYGNPLVVLAKIRSVRVTLTSLGLAGLPLYVTEFGWTTKPPGTVDYAPEARRPGYITRTLAALAHLDCGVAGALLYTWVTPERNPQDGQDWYGINTPDGATTPDVAAFSAGLKAAGAPGPTIRLCASR